MKALLFITFFLGASASGDPNMTCNVQADCEVGEKCINGRCVTVNPNCTYPCSEDLNCPSGYPNCVNGCCK